jgi:DNA-binding transcriptional regulator YiaG
MGVLVECISVIVRCSSLEEKYPGGVAAYEADAPNRTFCTDEHLARNAEQAAALLTVMDLSELRGALDLTQEELADRLSVAQSNVSRLEKRRDMLISTLQEVVRALGGELRLSAVFPEGVVETNQF